VGSEKAEIRKLKAEKGFAEFIPAHLPWIICLILFLLGQIIGAQQSYQWRSSGAQTASGSASTDIYKGERLPTPPTNPGSYWLSNWKTNWTTNIPARLQATNDFPKLPEFERTSLVDEVPQIVTLAWDDNPATNIAGVMVYQGMESLVYDTSVRLVKTTNAMMVALPGTNYFAATWFYSFGSGTNTYERESDFSNEAVFVSASPATNVLVTVYVATNTTLGGVFVEDKRFWRVLMTNPPPGNLFFKTSISKTNF